MANGKKPKQTFRSGAITASVWENERSVNGRPMTIKSASLSRNYQDREGNWKATSSGMSALDVRKAILVLEKAFEFMVVRDREAVERFAKEYAQVEVVEVPCGTSSFPDILEGCEDTIVIGDVAFDTGEVMRADWRNPPKVPEEIIEIPDVDAEFPQTNSYYDSVFVGDIPVS